jgi:uncharacterized protein (TIGR03067 family)
VNRQTAVLLAFALTLSAVAAPVPKGIGSNSDAKKLEGTWVSTSLDTGDGAKPFDTFWLVIATGQMQFGAGTTPTAADSPFHVDEGKSPRQLDVTWRVGKDTHKYIYYLDGDTLTTCHVQDSTPRPTEFKGGDKQFCIVWKRAKKD